MSWKAGEVIVTDEQVKIALENGLYRELVCGRIDNLDWDVERAISEPINQGGSLKGKYTSSDLIEAERNGISAKTFTSRVLTYGYSIERAKTEPPQKRGRKRKHYPESTAI